MSLLEQTGCSIVIFATEVAPIVKQLEDIKSGLRTLTSPPFQEMLETEHKQFTYEKRSFEEARNNPIVVLHSSGSTGIPKPINMTYGPFSMLDNERNLPGVLDAGIVTFPSGISRAAVGSTTSFHISILLAFYPMLVGPILLPDLTS